MMERYSSYSETNVNWIPSIPAHWEKKSLRSFIKLFTEKGYGDAQLLSVTRERGVIMRNKDDKEENHNFVPEDLSGYKHILPGDFVINKMKSWQGSYGVSAFEGIVSPAYFTCKLSNVEKDYFSWAIRSRAYVPFFTQYSKGIRVDQWDLDPIALMKIPFFLPSVPEQKTIVDYLNCETQKIDKFIAEKEKQLSLLDELKQAEIAQAVTKGLDPNTPMKDSGVSWIGQIPEHWKMMRNKSFMRPTDEKVGDRKNEFTLLSLTKQGVIIRDTSEGKGKFPKDYDTYLVVRPSNLVFCLFDIDETPRTVGLVKNIGMLTGAYSNFEFYNNLVLPEFAYYYYIKVDDVKGLRPYYTGLRKVVKSNTFAQLRMPVPPLDEQERIVNYINRKCEAIKKLSINIEQEITQLKEYKQRLIADVVTGQIKVC